MNDKAIAERIDGWERFKKEHATAFDLGSCTSADYLHNRLWWAFQAGVEAGERSAFHRLPAEQPRSEGGGK